MIIALVNNKGGVGKTTTTVNLAAALAQSRRVLLVDADAQCSASLSLGIRNAERTLYDVLFNNLPAAEAIHPGAFDVLPASPELAHADVSLTTVPERVTVMQRKLAPIKGKYDFILVDSPPSMSLLVVNILTACDAYIIPVVPQYLALEGLAAFMRAIHTVEQNIGGAGQLLGVLITIADYRTRATQETVELLRGHFGRKAFKTEIRVNTRLAEAPSYGKSIFDYDASASGAVAYSNLAIEVQNRARKL